MEQVEWDAAGQQTGDEAAEAYSPLPTQWRVESDERGAAEQEDFEGGAGDAEEQRADEPSTDERRIVRPVRGRMKLRKMNDRGKLEVVHNSSDFNSLMLRPRGQK